MRKRRDYASVLIWAAVLVTVVRYAGAFIASDLGEITGWVSEALSLAMGLTGLGMGVLDVLGGAYIFDGWRRSMPRAGQKWPFRFRILTVFAFGLFAIGIWILVPFTVSRVSHQTMEQVLGMGWGLWTWSVAVNVAPYVLIGGVVTGNVGVVGVYLASSAADGKVGGNLPESAGQLGQLTGKGAESGGPIYRNWHEVPESEWEWIAGASTSAVMKRYRLTVEKTARNWRNNARRELGERARSPQPELLSERAAEPGEKED
jgi:MFS family permease